MTTKCCCCGMATGYHRRRHPDWCHYCYENCREQILEDEKLSEVGEHKVDPPPDDWTLEYKNRQATLTIHRDSGDEPLRLLNPSFEVKRNSIKVRFSCAMYPGFVYAPYIPDQYKNGPNEENNVQVDP